MKQQSCFVVTCSLIHLARWFIMVGKLSTKTVFEVSRHMTSTDIFQPNRNVDNTVVHNDTHIFRDYIPYIQCKNKRHTKWRPHIYRGKILFTEFPEVFQKHIWLCHRKQKYDTSRAFRMIHNFNSSSTFMPAVIVQV